MTTASPQPAPMHITAAPVPGFSSRNGHSPLVVVQHVMLGTEDSTRQEFAKGKKSSNYGISASGEIVCYVPPTHSAWANGNLRNPALWIPAIQHCVTAGINPNDISISIEWEGAHRLAPGAWVTVPWRNPSTGKVEQISTIDPTKVRAFWTPPPPQLAAGIELTHELCAEYNIPADRTHILRHSDFDSVGKWFCPSNGFPLKDLITAVSGLLWRAP